MDELKLNPDLKVVKLEHDDPDIIVYVVDDFLLNPETITEYAQNTAYFGPVGSDHTAYPGIRDRLPRPYERALARLIELVFGISDATISRCMLSLVTLKPDELIATQKLPHIDSLEDNQMASVHYLSTQDRGGTSIYRYKPRNLLRVTADKQEFVREMIEHVKEHAADHSGYLLGDTSLFKREVCIDAKYNRIVLYPGNLLHCANLGSPASYLNDIQQGRLSVASFFQIHSSANKDN
jgi:hypothetical protein